MSASWVIFYDSPVSGILIDTQILTLASVILEVSNTINNASREHLLTEKRRPGRWKRVSEASPCIVGYQSVSVLLLLLLLVRLPPECLPPFPYAVSPPIAFQGDTDVLSTALWQRRLETLEPENARLSERRCLE